ATAVRLGADGKLPELKLEEGASQEKAVERSTTSSLPVLLALFASVGMSVLMLLVPTGGGRTEPETKATARWTIQKYYISQETMLEPYQEILRRALQAHT